MWIHEKIVIWGNIKMKRKKIWISVIASMLIGTVSVAASSGIELHEFFNEKGEKVIAVDEQGSYVTEVLEQ